MKTIIDIIKESRTVEETFGIGIKEEQARMQVIVDILAKYEAGYISKFK